MCRAEKRERHRSGAEEDSVFQNSLDAEAAMAL